ncbi:MAG TPA: hypothetical protein VLX59_07975, partial [Acidimicrobiales bacterium]|nr:hypothetical protein [Acidimicrobiales bacterium]
MTPSTARFFAIVASVACACGGSTLGSSAAQSVGVNVTPPTASVPPGGSQVFSAAVTGAASTAVTWTITEGAAGGTVSASGAYVAPQATGTFHVVATSQADTTKSGSAVVTVTAVAVTVAVSPSSIAVAPGSTQTFSATVTNSSNTNVTWSVAEGAAGGSISSTGVYTAPSTDGTYHVVATSVADGSATATAVVQVASLYTLPSDRVTQWQPGVTYNGGIPTNRTQCGATLSPSGGDDTSAINA